MAGANDANDKVWRESCGILNHSADYAQSPRILVSCIGDIWGMAVDVDALIAPFSEEAPAGPDLSYDPARQDIEGVFDRSISDDGSEGDEVDWSQIIRQIEAQAEATRDVWLPVYLMRAGAKAGRLESVENGAMLLAGLLENLWDAVHPHLEEYGYQGRKGPTESLTRIGEFIGPFRKVILIEHNRLGKYSGADFERFRDNGDSEDGYGMFRALLEETADEDLHAVVERLVGIDAAIRRADAVLTANAGDDTGTNFQPTYDAIAEMRKAVMAFAKDQKSEDESAVDSVEAGDRSGGGASSGSGAIGAINSREDVHRALDAIMAYYKKKEPGSPVPFALRRARDWVSLDFLSVLEDIAPNSLDEARRVLVNGRNDSSSDGWSSDSE
jgi:type VI secretion system ImpA family protein